MIQSAVKTFSGEPLKKGDLFKMAAGMIVGIGADMALSALLGTHVPEGVGWRKLMRRLGIFVLAMKAGEEAENYFNKVFEETRDALNDARKEMEKPVEAEGSVD